MAADSARIGERLVCGFELAATPDRAAELGLGTNDRQQAFVLPRLLDEVSCSPAHGLDRDVHGAPRRQDHHRQRFVGGVDALQQIEALGARSGVARVVEVHQDDVVVLQLQRPQQLLRRRGGVDDVALGLQQQPQRLDDVGLIVGEEQACRRISSHQRSNRLSG
jgi:hypothetical protein